MLPASELLDTNSATEPSANTLPPLVRKLIHLLPALAALADLNKPAPTPVALSPAPAAPPTPPVAHVSSPNSTNPLANLPTPVLFSGTHSSGISNQSASPCIYSSEKGFCVGSTG